MEQKNTKIDFERHDMHHAQEGCTVKPRDFEKYKPGSLSLLEVSAWILNYAGPNYPDYFRDCLMHCPVGKDGRGN